MQDEGDEEMIVVEEPQPMVVPYKKKVEKSTNNANENTCMWI